MVDVLGSELFDGDDLTYWWYTVWQTDCVLNLIQEECSSSVSTPALGDTTPRMRSYHEQQFTDDQMVIQINPSETRSRPEVSRNLAHCTGYLVFLIRSPSRCETEKRLDSSSGPLRCSHHKLYFIQLSQEFSGSLLLNYDPVSRNACRILFWNLLSISLGPGALQCLVNNISIYRETETICQCQNNSKLVVTFRSLFYFVTNKCLHLRFRYWS